MVGLTNQEHQEYWKDVYGLLSGFAHSRPYLVTVSLWHEPEVDRDRALVALNVGISLYEKLLMSFAEMMGWQDHKIEEWFKPVHFAIAHMQNPEETPSPTIDIEKCRVCPEYQEPYMHRMALVSHLCALLERSGSIETENGDLAPDRYSSAIEFLSELDKSIMKEEVPTKEYEKMITALGVAHGDALSVFGSDVREVIASIAASWAVMRSPSYQSSIGNIQGWVPRLDNEMADG